MPTLKQIQCSIELGPSNTKLTEYGARYSDGHVETFIAVPDTDLAFTIHLTSQGYIAPGLAFFVYIDGEYQCNRNRTNLRLPGAGVQPSEYETEFRLRQKEEKTSLGTFVARDWTFVKLDKVAANNAPNLNRNFTHNVGTIEVICLRCKSDDDEPQPTRLRRTETRAKEPDPGPKTAAKHTSARAEPTPAKIATPQQSEFGGMFGLFDGAADIVGLDGASDEQASHFPLPRLDGAADQPGVTNQWTGRGRDDMRGDKYLGLRHPERTAYKQYMRQAGESVSTHKVGEGCDRRPWNRDAAQDHSLSTPKFDISYAGFQQLGRVLQDVKKAAQEYIDTNPNDDKKNLDAAKADVLFISGLLDSLKGRDGLDKFPRALREVLIDIDLLKQCSVEVERRYPKQDWKPVVRSHVEQQVKAIQDLKLRKDLRLDDLDDCLALLSYFKARIEVVGGYLSIMEQFDKVNFDVLRERLRLLHSQRDHAEAEVRNMKHREHNAGHSQKEQTDWVPGRYHRDKDHAPSWADGNTSRNGWNTPDNQGGGGGGWEQVGVGTWQPDQQARHTSPRPESAAKWGGNDADNHNQRSRSSQSSQRDNRWGGDDNQHSSKQNDQWGQKSEHHAGGGWDNGQTRDDNANGWENQGQQNDGDKWGNGSSHKTFEHNFSNSNNKGNNGGWGGDNQANNWNSDDQQQQRSQKQPSNAWQPPAESRRSQRNDHTGSGHPAAQDGGDNRSIAAVSESKDAKAHIKPYWQSWNLARSQTQTSNPNTKKKRDEPRQVYTYPASPLPNLSPADNKVTDASHGVQVSRGTDYAHKTRRPTYIDSMEAPYAVFSFKYRSPEVLEGILRRKIDVLDLRGVVEQAEKARLMGMPKHALIEELMAKRGASSQGEKRAEGNRSARNSVKNDGGWGGGDNNGGAQGGGNGWGAQDHGDFQSHRSKASQGKQSSVGEQGWGKDKSASGGGGGWDEGNANNDSGGGKW